MISIKNNTEQLIWPSRWEIHSHMIATTEIDHDEIWANHSRTDFNKSWWMYTRIMKARITDEGKGCPECNVADFKKNDTVVREQYTAQSWQTFHPVCSLNKLERISDEVMNGVSEMRSFLQRDESLSED